MNKTKQQQQNNTTDTGSGQFQLSISSRQSATIIASSLIGVGVLTLPRVITDEVREAGWLVIIIGAIISAITIAVFTRLGFRFPQKTIVEYSQIILGTKHKDHSIIGRLLASPFILIFILYLLITTALVARTFGEVVVTAVLRETPLEVTILTMLGVACMLVLYDVEVLARINEILLPIIVLPILFIALFSFQSFELEFVLPLWPNLSFQDFLSGVLITLFAFQGYEVITVYCAHTFITRKTMTYNLLGLLVPSFIFLLIVIAGISVFGKEELSILMWPTLELVKVTQVPGVILERMESAFLGVWVAAVFTTTANIFYAATMMVSQFFGLETYRRWFGLGLLPVLFWLALLPQNVVELFRWQEYIGYVWFYFIFGFPIFLAIVAKIRKKGVVEIPYQEESQ